MKNRFGTPLGPVLGPSWPHLGAMLGHLGPSWGHLGPILGHLGPNLGHLSPSWSHLGTHWGSVQLFCETEDASLVCFWSFSLFLQSWVMWSLLLGSFRLSVLCSQSSLGLLRSCAHTPRASSFNHGLCGRCPRALKLGRAECAKRLNNRKSITYPQEQNKKP